MFDNEKDMSEDTAFEGKNQNIGQEQHEAVIIEGQAKQADAVDYKSLCLRVTADFQNFQKRVEKQKSEWMIIGQESIISKLLPVLQDLERALGTATVSQSHEVPGAWVEGLRAVHKNLLKVFADLEIQEISTSEEFNPELHEAIAQVESSERASGHIVDVVNKGYLFKGKVIKFAQVTVAK
jgi:molecular chaperone GrpE